MYIVSRFGGYGRGIWTRIDQGTVNIRDKGNRMIVKVRDGVVASETTCTRHKTTILRYGRDLTVKNNDKVVYQEFYDPKTLRGMVKGGLWRRKKDFPLCGTKGTLECFSTSSGACGKEVFTYDNGVIGYKAARWRKKLVVYRPTGKLWIVVNGKNHVSRNPIAEQLKSFDSDFNIWRFMDGKSWDITIYDADGQTIVTQGHFENRQKEGKWLQEGKIYYYMAGVKVSRSLYEEDPAKWNPQELLCIPNAQLRCSLLGRFGYDKLLEKIESKVIETSHDGGQLVEIIAGSQRGTERNIDKTMRLIKVICPSTQQSYVLRVPPDIDNFEKARQWTFGLQRASIQNGVQFEFIRET